MEPRHTDVTLAPSERTRGPIADVKHVSGDCQAVNLVLARVGDKWSVLIVMLLGDGPKRFNAMKHLIGGISQRMLSLTLRGLERDGLVTRTVTPSVPIRVDYALTDLGRSLWRPVEALGAWAHANHGNIKDAQKRYDAREDGPSVP